jgi:aquaporin Z
MSEPNEKVAAMIHKLIAEMFGTFTLVFAGTGAIIVNDLSSGAVTHVGIALTFGLAAMAMIYALGEHSGAHINPAVTFAFCVAGRISIQTAMSYVVAQCAGAVVASVALRFLFPEHGSLGATLPSGGDLQSFVLEIILTAILMVTILAVATGSKESGVTAGLAIGAVVASEALFAGPICGASMNPARSLAPALVSGELRALWIYLVAPIIGAVLGVLLWAWMRNPLAVREDESLARQER